MEMTVTPYFICPLRKGTTNIVWWYVWFAGKPDWFIIVANMVDFIIVAGQPDFVRRVLGREPEEAFIEIREMSESEYLALPVRKYYAHLLEQLQITYPKAEPGAIINLGLLNWDEVPQAL